MFKELLVLIFIVSGFSSCCSLNCIDKKYAQINFTNEVSRNEAKIIAKKYLYDNDITNFMYFNPIVKELDDQWVITFVKRRPVFLVTTILPTGCVLVVDKKSGDVKVTYQNHR